MDKTYFYYINMDILLIDSYKKCTEDHKYNPKIWRNGFKLDETSIETEIEWNNIILIRMFTTLGI